MKVLATKTTKAYDLFNMLSFNRNISMAHKNELIESIRKFGVLRDIICVQTSLFGKKNALYIVDGQHLFSALQYLNLSINYKIVEANTKEQIVELMGTLNNTSKAWTLRNYADCYASINRREYQKVIDIYENTGININILIPTYGYNKPEKMFSSFGAMSKEFKSGSFKFYDESKGDFLVKELSFYKKKHAGLTNEHLYALLYICSRSEYRRSNFAHIFEQRLPKIEGVRAKLASEILMR